VTGVQFAVQTREAIIIEDTKNESRFVVPRFMLDKNLRSGIIVPIAYGTNDQAWAALVVAREGPLSFTKDEAGMLKLVGSMTGTAMERSQLFMSVQQYAEQLEARVHERQLVLQAERDRFQTLLAATEEALLVFDSEGLIVQVNRVFERQHGLTTTKLVGRTSLEVLGRDLMRLVQHSEPRSVWRGEFSVRRHDGSSYTVTASLAMVHNPLGDTIGFIASLRDPSYHDETNRIKEKFIANVSHELRTPLINVQLYVHLLENGVKNQHDQYLAIVKREVNRVQAMIDELLLSARLDRNGFPMQIQPVNLNLLLKTLVDDRVRHINNQGVSIELDLTTSPCRVLADEPMLIQAFANLLTNATTYTQEDGLIIIKTTIDASHQPSQVLISVKDTGLGIPASELPHLFERFFRGNAARVTGTTGTGLGLSIVKTVLERHGGTITVKSEVGKGSEFVVKLPLYMGGEGAVASQSLATPQH
jgi:two-component system phosphate regulon sensor histidine kinase PhoR